MEISKQKQLGILAGLSLPLLLAALLLFWRAGEPSAAIRIDTAEISARYTDSLRIGVDQDLPPYAYVDSNGTIKGFLVDLARSLALEYGLDVELYSRSQADMIQALAAGDLDLVVTNTDDPGAYLSSDVLIESEDAIFVRGDNSYISTLEDLRNLAVAINTASLTSAVNSYINENNQDSLKIVMNQEHGFLLLLNMEVEAYLGNKASGYYLLQKWNQEEYFKSVGAPFNAASFRFLAAQDHEDLLALLNSSLSIAKQNGTYDKVYEKWFGQTVKSYEKKIRQTLFVTLSCLVLLLFIAAISVVFNNRLKKEVDARTLALNQANQELSRQKDEINAADQFKEEILNSVQNGIITLDAAGAVSFINDRAADILEVSSPELLGQAAFSSPLFYWLNKDKLTAVLGGKGPFLGIKAQIRGAEETKFIVYQIGVLRKNERDLTGAVISFKDVSKEHRLEEELFRQDQNRVMRLQVSEFIHEIKTPMTSIKTLADLLPAKVHNPDFQIQFVEIINSEMERIAKMIGALENYAKPGRQEMGYRELAPVVNNLELLLASRLAAKGIRLESDIPDNLEVYVNRVHLIQVLINLINNAADAFEQAGRTRAAAIRISARPAAGMVEIAVSDNGSGIPAVNLERIFEPFFTTRQDGTGLGLYICHRLAAANNGTIRVESREGQGTRVTITLIGKGEDSDGQDSHY